MKKSVVRLNVSVVLTSFVAVLSACGGGGGGGGKGTTINGRIQNIAQVQLEATGQQREIVQRRSWGFLGIAYAQSSNLTVDAIVDSDTTDSGGRFELRVREENLTEDVRLVFNTTPALTLDIIAIEDSNISLVVSLAPDTGEVAVDTFQIDTGELECQGNESFSYIEPRVTTMTIDGSGSKQCIRAQDECRFTIEIGGRLNIGGCSDGVLAEDDSQVRLTPGNTSSLNIDASGNGMRGTDSSSIIVTGFDVGIAGNDFGISANKSAFVQVSVPAIGTCDIEGKKAAVDASNSAIVDIGECRTS
jgi:hypothetical protein